MYAERVNNKNSDTNFNYTYLFITSIYNLYLHLQIE